MLENRVGTSVPTKEQVQNLNKNKQLYSKLLGYQVYGLKDKVTLNVKHEATSLPNLIKKLEADLFSTT